MDAAWTSQMLPFLSFRKEGRRNVVLKAHTTFILKSDKEISRLSPVFVGRGSCHLETVPYWISYTKGALVFGSGYGAHWLGSGSFRLELKRRGPEADHSPLSSMKVKNE